MGQKLVGRGAIITGIILVFLAPIFGFATSQTEDVTPWTNPTNISITKLGVTPALTSDPYVESANIACDPITFRFITTTDMQNGCFVHTAFGQMSIGGNIAIFDTFNEAFRVETGPEQLLPVPGSLEVATTTNAPIKGQYLHFYTYFPNNLQLNWMPGLQPYYLLTGQSNYTLLDANGQPLAINAQSIAYASHNDWMVVESPWHAFMRVNMATFDKLPFAPSFTNQSFDFAQHNSQVAISENGRYVVIASNEYKMFTVYDLASCTGTITSQLDPLHCASHEYWPALAAKINGLRRINDVRFSSDDTLEVDTSATSSPAVTTYELAPAGRPAHLIDYLALGDSYTSGEGAFNYIESTDTDTNACHLSVHSYPILLGPDAFTATGSHSVACSGADMGDIYNTDKKYSGQATLPDVGNDTALAEYIPGYLPQYQFVAHYRPNVITVSIGGNDVGFGDFLHLCASPIASLKPLKVNPSTCYSSYEDRYELLQTINDTFGKWESLFTQLRNGSKQSTIYVIGYPQVVVQGNCALNVHLDSSEIELTQQFIDRLNGVIEQAAQAAGVQYVDISQALAGHRLCETRSYNVALNGLTEGNDTLHFVGKESFHPNTLGQRLIEQAILQQTHNFAAANPLPRATPPPVINPNDPILNKPKTGRAIRKRTPAKSITSSKASKGSKVKIKVATHRTGLPSDKPYTVNLDSVPIGSATSSEGGEINGEGVVPPDTDAGEHVIDVVGPDEDGDTIEIPQPIYVPDSAADSDGDGIGESQDSCPDITNSGVDADSDGTDDACDNEVGTFGSPPNSGSVNSSVQLLSPQNMLQPAISEAGILQDGIKMTSVSQPLVVATASGRQVLGVHYRVPLLALHLWRFPLFLEILCGILTALALSIKSMGAHLS